MTVERERTPAPALRPFVRSLSVVRSEPPAGRERVIPVGSATLLVNLAENAFRGYADMDGTGPTSLGGAIVAAELRKVVDREASGRCCGWFVPVGSRRLLPRCRCPSRGRRRRAGRACGNRGLVLRERLLLAPTDDDRLAIVELACLIALEEHGEARPFIAAAADAMERGRRWRTAARDGAAGRRLALPLLPRAVGLPPARFRRVRRLQRLLGAVGSSATGRERQEHGFCDQARTLVNGFQASTGMHGLPFRHPQHGLVA